MVKSYKHFSIGKIFAYSFVKHTHMILLISFLIFFTLASNYLFINPRNIQALIRLIPEFAIVVLGVGLLLIAGEIDLSISSTIPFCAYVFTLLLQKASNIFLSLGITISLGIFIALINGLITTKVPIPSFITTLGMLMLLRGILYTHSGMHTIGIGGYLKNEPLLVR
ncbi:MAG: hypothetical protein NC826_06565, partial [Candidatus Omnitrophica bacterium]|nr:hypothetical protein [Candidatus Omnitrophota bacterium]